MFFDLIYIVVLFKWVVHFDEHSKLIISFNPPIDGFANDGEYCMNIFVFIEHKLIEILLLQIMLLEIKIKK